MKAKRYITPQCQTYQVSTQNQLMNNSIGITYDKNDEAEEGDVKSEKVDIWNLY